jgi:hypothetical protein
VKLVMTLVVRDEADIIRANFDYHLANGVDFVIVTDHASSDGTSEVLCEYEQAGVAQVIRDDAEGHHQSRRVTHMAELARTEHHASWVIHNDADEFWWPQVGSLRDVFISLPERYAQIVVPRRNFRPLPEAAHSNGQPFYQRLLYRELESPQLISQPKVAHRPLPGLVVAPGNHSLSPAGLPCVPMRGLLEIFHYPMRSYEQFERKVLQTGVGYERVADLSPGVGSEQLQLLALQRAGKLREHYERLVLDGRALQAGLLAGTIVLDPRLADFMRDLAERRAMRAAPGEPYAQELLGQLMSALVKVQDTEKALRALRAENRWLTGQAHALESERAELTTRLERLSQELQGTSQALHLLRTSKLIRHTAWARRLYYKVSGTSNKLSGTSRQVEDRRAG